MATETLSPAAEWLDFPARLDAFLARFFREQAERYAYGPFFEPYYGDLASYVLRPGKRLRPLLLAASYRTLGGERPWDDPSLLRAAAAMELFHAFTLIHDDVIDRADLRRGLPAFHRVAEARLGQGKNQSAEAEGIALVAGNLLHALALDTLLATDFPAPLREAALRRFLQAVADTGAGEIGDIVLGTRDLGAVPAEEIERVCSLKTTRYTFETPLVLGAILAGREGETLLDLARLADPLGLAFQIADDLADFAAAAADLRAGKKTLLLRSAHDRLGETDRALLLLALSLPEGESDASRLGLLRGLVGKSGAPALLREREAALRRQAREELARSSLPAAFGALLDRLDCLSVPAPRP